MQQTSDTHPLPVTVHREAFWHDAARGGLLGAAEAYLACHWSSSDLCQLFQQTMATPEVWQRFERQRSIGHRLQLAVWRVKHSNIGRQWLENASHHFDLGYDFFRHLQGEIAWNDKPGPERRQQAPQQLEIIAQTLCPQTGDHVLDLSSDWGAISIYLAEQKHCRITRVCHSRQHYEHIRRSVDSRGLSSQITVLYEDFRDVTGRYDHIVCLDLIDMLGRRASKQLLRRCSKWLRPGARVLIQNLCEDSATRETRHTGSWDFVRRYIHLGGSAPQTRLWRKTPRLKIQQLDDLTEQYAVQTKQQRQRLERNSANIQQLGFDTVFQRLWQFHLSLRQAQLETGQLRAQRIVLRKDISSKP